MKILIFTEIFDSGGIDTFIINLINTWPDQNDTFELISNKDYPGLKNIKEKIHKKCKIIIHELKSYSSLNFNKYLKKLFSPIIKYVYIFINILLLKKVILLDDYDFLFVVNGGYPGGDTCRAASICWSLFSNKPKSIHNFHNLAVPLSWHNFVQETILDLFLSKSTKNFITVSSSAKKSILKRRLGINKFKVSYIYNGIESNYQALTNSNKNIRDEFNIPLNTKICLILATYEKRKGHEFLLKSFKNVLNDFPNAILLMFGYGTDEEISFVKKLIITLGIGENVRLNEFISDTRPLFEQSDLLLISSQEYESFGLTAIEAMSYGLAIVSTNVGGLPEVILDNEVGYCVHPSDVINYSNKITTLLKNDSLRMKFGINGKKRYKNFFTADSMSRKYYNYLKSN